VIKEIKLILFFCIGLFLGGMITFAHASSPQWSSWSPQEPVPHCTQQFTASGAGSLGWVQIDILYTYTQTGQVANCRAQCTDAQKCGAQLGNIGGYGTPATRTATCPSGTFSNGECTDPCPTGAASSASWWIGCFDVDELDNGCDAGARRPYPSQGVCNGSCVVRITQWTACRQPMTGGGPQVCDGVGTLTGATCSNGDNFIPSDSMKCPTGYSIGTVNGKSGCYKSGSDAPVQTTTTQSTDPQTGVVTTTKTATDPATNTTTTTTTTFNPSTGTTTTQQQSSPTNPNQPMTDPTKQAPGENQDPFEIDETGTPTDGSLSQAKSEFETASNAHKTFIDGLANQGTHGMTWDWTFELPSGTCSAYTFMIAGKSFTLDPCEKLGMVRDALGFLIYITTALALLSIATGYGKEGK
jgi:hypothetical protein